MNLCHVVPNVAFVLSTLNCFQIFVVVYWYCWYFGAYSGLKSLARLKLLLPLELFGKGNHVVLDVSNYVNSESDKSV